MSVPPPKRRTSPNTLSGRQSGMVQDTPVAERGIRRSASLEKPRARGIATLDSPRLASRAGGLTAAEVTSGAFSECRDVQLDAGLVQRVAIIGSRMAGGKCMEQPTIMAVSGEEQRHVSKFFRAWRAEDRGWQVFVPLRREGVGLPYFFDAAGVDSIVQLIEDTLADRGEIAAALPHHVELGRLHLVGSSNGGATVLAAACRVPHLVASLTLVTGFIPKVVEDVAPLKDIPSIHLYAGDLDSFRHDQALTQLQQFVEKAGGKATLQILPGTTHMSIGKDMDMTAFWNELEASRDAVKTDTSRLANAETALPMAKVLLEDTGSAAIQEKACSSTALQDEDHGTQMPV